MDTGFTFNKPVMQHTAMADLVATKDWYYTVVDDLSRYLENTKIIMVK